MSFEQTQGLILAVGIAAVILLNKTIAKYLWNHTVKRVTGWGCSVCLLICSQCAIAILVLVIQFVSALNQHQEDLNDLDDSKIRIDDLKLQVEEQSNTLVQNKAQLASMSETLHQTETALANANESLSEQSRSLNSVLFNVETSFSGKERFALAIRDLERLVCDAASSTGFESLICDEGVAVYWFDSKTENITGFHLYTNADINRILSGDPLGQRLFNADGSVVLKKNEELGIALRQILLKKTYAQSNNPIEQDRATESILHEIEVILRYVYRASSIQIEPFYHGRGKRYTPTGSYAVSFSYIVNPFAKERRIRSVGNLDLELTASFLQSLHDVTLAEFSSRVITELRKRNLEPKVTVSDIKALTNLRKQKEATLHDPFATHPK